MNDRQSKWSNCLISSSRVSVTQCEIRKKAGAAMAILGESPLTLKVDRDVLKVW
jgi:hypothetical protein